MAAPRKKNVVSESPVVKADAIRNWFKENPDGTATQCEKALKEQGIEVSSGHCQQVKNKSKAGTKVDVNQIKLAAAFVKENDGNIESAIAAIDQVGEFIKQCGTPEKAKSALEAYQSVADMLA